LQEYRTIPQVHVEFIHLGSSQSAGMLLDWRDSTLVEFNDSACLAWRTLTDRTQNSVSSYAAAMGVDMREAEEELARFAERLASNGWLIPDP
jgi:hypothetical protein